MKFGSWNEEIHNDAEQQKRIKKAESADLTPATIDYNNQSGVFKGSGKTPYEVTLDFCPCGDFRRRKLPCKHIYRLAMELKLFNGNYDVGINKYDLSSQMFSLDVNTQKLLYDMSCSAAYGEQRTFIVNKSEYSNYIDLLAKGFCIEILSNYSEAFDTVPVSEIKEAFADFETDNKPKYNAIKKTYIKWISENDDIISSKLHKKYAILQFNEQTLSKVHTIVSRYRKKFIKKDIPFDEDILFYSSEYEEVFDNEII